MTVVDLTKTVEELQAQIARQNEELTRLRASTKGEQEVPKGDNDMVEGNYLFRAYHNFRTLVCDPSFHRQIQKYILLMLLSAAIFQRLEKWNFEDALYFCFDTSSTIGLGNLTPNSDEGKLFGSFFALISIGIGSEIVCKLNFWPTINTPGLYGIYNKLIVYLGLGMAFYIEAGYTPVDSFRYCIQLVTTIGYGDMPEIEGDDFALRWFTIAYSFFGTSIAQHVITDLSHKILDGMVEDLSFQSINESAQDHGE